MLHLVNLSNMHYDRRVAEEFPCGISGFLQENTLDGVELLCYDKWGSWEDFPVIGAHLLFFPYWLDFWRGDFVRVLQNYGSKAAVSAAYGGVSKEDWLALWRENIRNSVASGAKYLVMHVSDASFREVYTWKFHHSDREVMEATAELMNLLADEIPEDVELLYENLWWPGLRLNEPILLQALLDLTEHRKTGIMLDIGHLMNTNQALRSEREALEFLNRTLENLGELSSKIYGVHLSSSLSGEYVRAWGGKVPEKITMEGLMQHIAQIDEHRPFRDPGIVSLVEEIAPKYLVHEFLYASAAEWQEKVRAQRFLFSREGKR